MRTISKNAILGSAKNNVNEIQSHRDRGGDSANFCDKILNMMNETNFDTSCGETISTRTRW